MFPTESCPAAVKSAVNLMSPSTRTAKTVSHIVDFEPGISKVIYGGNVGIAEVVEGNACSMDESEDYEVLRPRCATTAG